MMCEARICVQAAQIERSAECAREALTRFRAVGDLWGEAEVWEPVCAALWMGRVIEAESLVPDSLSRAERIGHFNAVWAYGLYSAQLLVARGNLVGAERAMTELHEFSAGLSVGWAYLNYLVLGTIAHYRGKFDEAAGHIRRGLDSEPVSYLSGMFSGALFWTLAAKGDVEADKALAAARLHLPVPGRPLSPGSCGCLAFVVEGLALLGRREDCAALQWQAEEVVANGPVCLHSQHLFRTSAGIAVASARNWTRAEEHHRIAIHQADSAPYRVAQPFARYWYADMLWSRGLAGDQELARGLLGLGEAVTLFESMGMAWHARRAAGVHKA